MAKITVRVSDEVKEILHAYAVADDRRLTNSMLRMAKAYMRRNKRKRSNGQVDDLPDESAGSCTGGI